jgi:hypothetical protein
MPARELSEGQWETNVNQQLVGTEGGKPSENNTTISKAIVAMLEPYLPAAQFFEAGAKSRSRL